MKKSYQENSHTVLQLVLIFLYHLSFDSVLLKYQLLNLAKVDFLVKSIRTCGLGLPNHLGDFVL